MMKKKLLTICILGLSAFTFYNLFGEKLKADEVLKIEETSNTTEYSETVESFDSIIPSTEQEQIKEATSQNGELSTEGKKEGKIQESSTPVSKAESTSDTLQISTSEVDTSSEHPITSTSSVEATDTSRTSSVESSSTETTSSSTVASSISSRPKESSTAPIDSREESKVPSKPVKGTEGSIKNEASPEVSVNDPNQAIVDSPDPTPFSVHVQPTLPTYSNPSETLGLSSQGEKVELAEELRVSKVAESDLNGFELPLLKTIEDRNRAILIYEGIHLVGKNEESNAQIDSSENLLNELTTKLFGQEFKDTKKTDSNTKEPGDLLYKKGSLIGMYLGDDYYLSYRNKDKSEEDSFGEIVIEKFTSDEPETVFQSSKLTNLTMTDYGKEVEKNYPASIDVQQNNQTTAFIEKISDSARDLGMKYDVFASVMIAQAILESGSGTSQLSVAPYHNLFGIKGTFKGSFVNFATQEDAGSGEMYSINAAFRSYPNYGESLGDYVTLIRSGIQGNENYYSTAWRSNAKNYLRAADALTGKYATDTSYNKKISSLIAAYHLTQYDAPKSLEGTQTSAVLQGKENIPAEYRSAMKFPDYDGKDYNSSGSYPVGQCTWYAYNRVAQLGKKVDDFMGNGGEWGRKGRSLGYKVTQTPTAGYLISFSPGTAGSDPRYGHVAFVEAVTSDGILISEGNVVGGTTISYRVINNELAKSNLVSYIEPK